MNRSLFVALCSIILAVAGCDNAAEPGPAVGVKFPHQLSAPDQTGEGRTLESVMGEKGVAIFFVRSADWCPFCQVQLVDVNRHLAQFRALRSAL